MRSCDLTKDLASKLKSGNEQIYVLVIRTLCNFTLSGLFWILSSGWLVFYYFPTVLLKDTELKLSRWFSNSSDHLSCRPKSKTSPTQVCQTTRWQRTIRQIPKKNILCESFSLSERFTISWNKKKSQKTSRGVKTCKYHCCGIKFLCLLLLF